MPKIKHEKKGKCPCSTLIKNDFKIRLNIDIVQLFYGDAYTSFSLEKLEEFIKTHRENLRR